MTKEVVLYRDINKKSDFDEVLQIKGIDNTKCPPFDYDPPKEIVEAKSNEELYRLYAFYPHLKMLFHNRGETRVEGILKSIYELEFKIQIIVPNIYPMLLPYGRAYCISQPSTLYQFNEYPTHENLSILAFINNSLTELALKIVNERGNLNE